MAESKIANARFAAVIYISGFDECPKRAIGGILPNMAWFSQVILVYPGYKSDRESLYKEWVENRATLERAGVAVRIVPSLKVEYVAELADGILEIPPNCQVRQGALDTIQGRMQASQSASETHFALSTVTRYERFSLLFGFLMIAQVINWFWDRVWEFGKLYQFTDVRYRAIVEKAGKRYIPEERSFVWRFWNATCLPKAYAGDQAVLRAFESPAEYVHWVLYQHNHMGWGWWVFPFFTIYLILTFAGLGLLWYQTVSVYILLVLALEITASNAICSHYMSMPYLALLCLLFPIYWIAFPVVLIYCKNTVPKSSWSR